MLHQRSELQEHHDRFVRRVIEGETVWGLDSGNGYATCQSANHSDGSVILFWSDRGYATRAIKAGFDECSVASITLLDFLFRWLPGMDSDGVSAGCNWTRDLAGLEKTADGLQVEIVESMPLEMIAGYRSEVTRQLAEQDRG